MDANDNQPESELNQRIVRTEPLKGFLGKVELGGLYHHCRLARFLSAAGFDIRRIERKDNHADVWVVHMRRGFVGWGQEIVTAQVYVQTFLRRQGIRYPKREINVMLRGDRLVVTFNWQAGTPGMLIFWGGNLRVKCHGRRDPDEKPPRK